MLLRVFERDDIIPQLGQYLRKIPILPLTNAAQGDGKAHASSVTLRVEQDTGSQRVILQVEDDGPGVTGQPPPTTRSAGSPKPGGTGLGLPIVRGLAEASGGTLRISEREGGGTVVTVTLPAATGAAATAAALQ